MEDYLRNQNREQREVISQQEEAIKLLKREIFEVKLSIFKKISQASNIAHSNDVLKNIHVTDIIDELKDDLYYDIQEQLESDLEEEYKKELSSDYRSIR